MNNFFKGLIVFILVTMIIVVIPIKLISDLGDMNINSVTLEGQYETYLQKFEKLLSSESMDVDSRGLAMEMLQIANDNVLNTKIKGYAAIGYVSLVLTLIILSLGIYGAKKWENKKYIAKAFIISSIVSILWLAFWAVTVYFTYIK